MGYGRATPAHSKIRGSLAPTLLPNGESRPTPRRKQLAQVVFSPPTGPARRDSHDEDPVAVVQSLAQSVFQLRSCQRRSRRPDRMHQRHGPEFPQLLIELGVAVMCEHLANENVKVLPHRWDSNVKANEQRLYLRNLRATRALRRYRKH